MKYSGNQVLLQLFWKGSHYQILVQFEKYRTLVPHSPLETRMSRGQSHDRELQRQLCKNLQRHE
jgi:hypothetical protein